jgi:Ca2+-transporting ATPase
VLRLLLEVLREPMFGLLIFAGGVYLLLGNRLEASALLVFATLSVLITVVQARRSERVLEALRNVTSPRARVIRDGAVQRIAGTDVVPGDLLALAEGDRVPADAVVLQGEGLLADESLLTGESVPVAKQPRGGAATPLASGASRIHAGTLLVRGEGLARVLATGGRSAIGRIGGSLAGIEAATPRLQRQIRRLMALLGGAGIGVTLLTVVLHGWLRHDWMQAVLAGIALGMSILPEELPVVLTVFTAMGAWRIAQAGVLTRRAAAIETLGAATVLCADKTGTLTQNRMTVMQLWTASAGGVAVGGAAAEMRAGTAAAPARELLEAARMACSDMPIDPMERALHAVAAAPPSLHAAGTRPATASRPLMLRLWHSQPAPELSRVACKGAPEAVLELCSLDGDAADAALDAAAGMASQGLRVLAVADAVLPWPAVPAHELLERPPALRLLGLVGLADPLRPGVPAAVAQCRAAGIRVLMITGDHPATALAIARQAGLADGDGVLGGADIDTLDDTTLRQRLAGASVCARIRPEQKLRIVRALQAGGEVVAMTGDGVNDAPALKAADIGIAMGERGTDVAREAAALVLLHDDFDAMVAAIHLGRRIGDNLRKAVRFIFAVHVPVAGLALLPLILDLPLILGPLQIALLEMAIDPVCSLVFEAEAAERTLMSRPPRRADEPLLSLADMARALLHGAAAWAVCAALYLLALRRGMPPDEVRALVFVTLLVCVFALVLVHRRFGGGLEGLRGSQHAVLLAVAAPVALSVAALLHWPAAARLFGFGPLHPPDLLLALGAGATLVAVLQALKPRAGPAER